MKKFILSIFDWKYQGNGEHDWYISNIFPMGDGQYQVYFKCKKCGEFDENEGSSPEAMLKYQKKHEKYGCNG